MIDINQELKNAMKQKDLVKLEVIRSIKSEFSKREHNGEEMTEQHKMEVLAKMVSQRQDSIEQFKKAGRLDLVESETAELNILKEFAPKEISEEELKELTEQVIAEYITHKEDGYKLSMKDMKPILTKVKEIHPSASANVISVVLKSQII